LNFINRPTGAELRQYFCAYTIKKQIEDSTGFEPHNLPSWVHQRDFPCPDSMGSGGQLR